MGGRSEPILRKGRANSEKATVMQNGKGERREKSERQVKGLICMMKIDCGGPSPVGAHDRCYGGERRSGLAGKGCKQETNSRRRPLSVDPSADRGVVWQAGSDEGRCQHSHLQHEEQNNFNATKLTVNGKASSPPESQLQHKREGICSKNNSNARSRINSSTLTRTKIFF